MAASVNDPAELIRRMMRVLHNVHDSGYLYNLRYHHPSPQVRQYLDSLLLHVDSLLVYLLNQQLCPTASIHILNEVNNHIRLVIRPLRRFLLRLRRAEQRRQQFLQVQQTYQQRTINTIHLIITDLQGGVLVVQQHHFVTDPPQNPNQPQNPYI